MCYISSFLLIPNGSRVLPLSMRYASLAFRTLSLLDLMNSSEISVMSLAQWSLMRKCLPFDWIGINKLRQLFFSQITKKFLQLRQVVQITTKLLQIRTAISNYDKTISSKYNFKKLQFNKTYLFKIAHMCS